MAADSPGCAGWLALLLVVAIPIALVQQACGDDDPADDGPAENPAADDGITSCPPALERQGPFVSGVDPRYDPRMDWDGDGISCES